MYQVESVSSHPKELKKITQNIDTEDMWTDIDVSSWIRTYYPSVRAGEDVSCLRSLGLCDRLI
jgi:hypothetical protein